MALVVQNTLGSSATKIDCSPEQIAKITNKSGSTIYYKSTEGVSSSSNDGSLASGAFATFSTSVYIVSGGSSRFVVESFGFNDLGIRRWSTVEGATPEVGESTAPVSGTIYVCEVKILRDSLLTGVEILNGATAETDKVIGILYDTSGNAVASSAVAGTTAATAKAYQQLAFTAQFPAKAGRYFIGYQANGTTTRFYSLKKGTTNIGASSTAGEFGVLTAGITPPSTFTEKVGPIAVTY